MEDVLKGGVVIINMYIKENEIFEIKSWYYWEKNREINIIKKETASNLYDFYLIMNNDFNDIDMLIKDEKI